MIFGHSFSSYLYFIIFSIALFGLNPPAILVAFTGVIMDIANRMRVPNVQSSRAILV